MATGIAIVGFLLWLAILAAVLASGAFTLRLLMIWIAATAVVLQLLIWSAAAGADALIFVGFLAAGYLRAYSYVRRRQGAASEAERARAVSTTLFIVAALPALAALTMPAVQSATAARRTQCRNNMHQLGLALNNYHSDYGCFPPAIATDGAGRPMHSWTVYLLPYLDEKKLYAAYNFAHAWDHAANTTVGGMRLSAFQCPSMPRTAAANRIDYGLVVCPGSVCGVDRPGMLKQVTDGPCETIVAAEMSHTSCPWTKPAATVNLRRGLNIPKGLPQGASSEHEGGAFFLFADGGVRFLSDQIDISTLQALCTAAGGEKVDPDEY